jgi:hypothetical protein
LLKKTDFQAGSFLKQTVNGRPFLFFVVSLALIKIDLSTITREVGSVLPLKIINLFKKEPTLLKKSAKRLNSLCSK